MLAVGRYGSDQLNWDHVGHLLHFTTGGNGELVVSLHCPATDGAHISIVAIHNTVDAQRICLEGFGGPADMHSLIDWVIELDAFCCGVSR